MLDVLQQFYIQMEIEPDDFHLFPGDSSLYTLRCVRCRKPITVAGSIGRTLLHVPTAMLYHWNMIQFREEQNHRESMLTPLLFTSYDNNLQSSKSFQEGLSWMEDLNICQKPTKYGQSMFCEAVKVDMENSKESSFHHTITSTLSLSSLCYLKIYLKPSAYTGISVVKK
jgi:hypothetical protein